MRTTTLEPLQCTSRGFLDSAVSRPKNNAALALELVLVFVLVLVLVLVLSLRVTDQALAAALQTLDKCLST